MFLMVFVLNTLSQHVQATVVGEVFVLREGVSVMVLNGVVQTVQECYVPKVYLFIVSTTHTQQQTCNRLWKARQTN